MLNMIISQRQRQEMAAELERIEARKSYDGERVAEYILMIVFGVICFVALGAGCYIAAGLE